MRVFIKQSSRDYITSYRGRPVHPGYIFGCVNGIDFVTAPLTTQYGWMPMYVLRNSVWVEECPCEIVSVIARRWNNGSIRLQQWKPATIHNECAKIRAQRRAYAQAVEAAVAEAEFRTMAAESAVNPYAEACRRRKGKGMGMSQPYNGFQYMQGSRALYGSKLEMNGYFVSLNESLADYMDGSRSSGVRPLVPVL